MGKSTEHLIGEGVTPEQLNDDRIGRALDKWNAKRRRVEAVVNSPRYLPGTARLLLLCSDREKRTARGSESLIYISLHLDWLAND